MRKLILIVAAALFMNTDTFCKDIYLGSTYGVKSMSDAIIMGSFDNKEPHDVFKIAGTFIIDRDLTVLTTVIDAAPNSVTIVNPGIQTAFYDTQIFCSSGMWGGIFAYGYVTISDFVI